mmetsp:Transcript_3432/g.10613  ORF Transcript_3432/g.10613 Transcript_3432/m.10613 type:complete len:216 (+) Transcript_3432:3-650(+)
MLAGAAVAAADDLAFDPRAYGLVLCNNLLTASRGVYVKAALSKRRLHKLSLLFYNAAFALVLVSPFLVSTRAAACLAWLRAASLEARLAWLASAGLGPLLQYAIFLCTHHNSALTTTVAGALKNILTAYVGMLLGDYAFSWLNFAGISLSCAASLIYSYAVLLRPRFDPLGALPSNSNSPSRQADSEAPPPPPPSPPSPPPPAARRDDDHFQARC